MLKSVRSIALKIPLPVLYVGALLALITLFLMVIFK